MRLDSMTTLACKFTPQLTFEQQTNEIKGKQTKRKRKSPSIV